MTALLQTAFLNAFSFVDIAVIIFHNSLKFVRNGQIDHKSALVETMTWCQPDAKTSSEPMMHY